MKFLSTLAVGFAVFASTASAQSANPPATIDPTTLGTQSFKQDFTTTPLSEGPDQTATNPSPSHTWRTILKGWAGTTPPDATSSSDSSTTWFGYDGDDAGSSPFGQGSNGVVINAAERAQPFNRTWRSGLLTTRFSFSQLYGYFEVYADLPTCTKGTWPAIWMLPTSGNGEIDFPETIGTSQYSWTVHDPSLNGGATEQWTPATCSNGFGGLHRYGVLWNSAYIGFYVDRQLVGQAVATPKDFTVPMYMLINLDVGGGWPGPPDPSLTSTRMIVQEVNAWPLS
ncbi:family 16 glycosylhydrolase [Caulobacter sp. S45]|jgi:hypothetical protein|uniref:glycoside hydrolase family 16 protein n=1 Tax=Caulobacter sp. S45 TaxID=1641861 RepID=UPI00131E9EE3|nr:family 16 glycosylhydrolase [Caulobacter sp. S45]